MNVNGDDIKQHSLQLIGTLALSKCTKRVGITEVLRKKLASDTCVVFCVEAKISINETCF